jgi:hypothetical protein
MHTTRLILTGLVAAATALSMSPTPPAAGASQAAAARPSPFGVTATASTSELVLGKRVTISGRVTPRAAGKTVVLKQKIGDGRWRTEDRTTLTRRGKFTFTDRPKSMDPRRYRVVKPASRLHSRGVSEVMPVTMYRWTSVNDLRARNQDRMYQANQVTIDTTDYQRSLRSWVDSNTDKTGFIDFNIARSCIKLQGTFGMEDSADVGSSVRIKVVGDGTDLYSGTFGLLESEVKKVDLHGVFRLAFTWESLAEPVPVAAVGSPRVLCTE